MIWIGTSGWSYEHWTGVLYPPGLPPRERLATYVRHYRTVEVNSTFYRWPRPATFASWRRRLPDDFTMAVKAPRGLTHGARLYAPERWIGRIGAGLHELGARRGPLLVQLPPDLPYDWPRLAYFLALLPPWLCVACEFRHPSWHREETFALLERHGAALCVMSGANLPCILRATGPLVYIRLHGPDRHHLYAGSYPDEDLRWWAARMGEWAAQGRTVHAYFNNDGDGNAVCNAARLRALLNI
ncbi:MAG: FIG003003: hypothetical protein [uncultured Thermomicrobiales bacterium]|uniref:DUF72 domain-containing protein n=1 Tax=uncultured Thermomicrobiales bacterium TaxID=1645740 RepID=A0A6J4V336_9BACT|nr:MAG: FIG003003: hypothetical protein [uncultured Thermomicrobiales bacterium]